MQRIIAIFILLYAIAYVLRRAGYSITLTKHNPPNRRCGGGGCGCN